MDVKPGQPLSGSSPFPSQEVEHGKTVLPTPQGGRGGQDQHFLHLASRGRRAGGLLLLLLPGLKRHRRRARPTPPWVPLPCWLCWMQAGEATGRAAWAGQGRGEGSVEGSRAEAETAHARLAKDPWAAGLSHGGIEGIPSVWALYLLLPLGCAPCGANARASLPGTNAGPLSPEPREASRSAGRRSNWTFPAPRCGGEGRAN